MPMLHHYICKHLPRSEVDLGEGVGSSGGGPVIRSNVGNQLATLSQGVTMVQQQSQTASTLSSQNVPNDQRGSMFVPYFPNR